MIVELFFYIEPSKISNSQPLIRATSASIKLLIQQYCDGRELLILSASAHSTSGRSTRSRFFIKIARFYD